MTHKFFDAFAAAHSCGTWSLRRGNEIGRGLLKTSAMGCSELALVHLDMCDPATAERLLRANAEQFHIQDEYINAYVEMRKCKPA